MPVFLPFRALRPIKDKVASFSAKTSDFKNQEEVVEDMNANPESYYHVTKQQLLSHAKKPVEHFFSIGAEFVKQKITNGTLIQDKVPCFYVYRQIDHRSKRTYTGIIGLVDVLDLENEGIKKHELTKVVREEYLYKQLHYTEVLGEPVLMGYKNSGNIDKIIQKTTENIAEYDFSTIDEKEHLIWLINNSFDIEAIEEEFLKVDAFYIADGHHRCASAVRNYERNQHPINRYFMVYLLDERQFHIESFHRLISGLTPEDTLNLKERLQENFSVEDFVQGQLYMPVMHGNFGLLTREHSFKLMLLKERRSANPESHLDVTLLENKILKPILHIIHPRTDHRLSYVSSQEDIQNVYRALQNGEIDMVISNFPVSFEEVKHVADANRSMPPKSTYIEPKLRGGLIIQKF